MTDEAQTERAGWADRMLAAISLACLPGALALVTIGALGNLAGVALGLAGAALVVAGGWYAVSRRGGPRVAGVTATAAGAGVLVAALIVADLTWWRIAAAIALGAAAAATAHSALGRAADQSPKPLRALVPPAAHPTPSRRLPPHHLLTPRRSPWTRRRQWRPSAWTTACASRCSSA